MSWNNYKIGDFLTRSKEPEKIEQQEEYTLVTIRMYHKGVAKRSHVKGSLIKSTTLYKVRAGQFILSGIDARNRAFGIVPDELDGAVVTNDFWTHNIDTSIIDINFFYWFTTTPQFYEACIKASEGTTNRQRLQANKFYSFDVLLPSIEEQKKWVKRISYIQNKHEQLNKELDQQQTYLQFLRQTILQEAVQGKLSEPGLIRLKDDRISSGKKILSSSNPANLSSDEPAAELLKRIKAEKEKLIKAGKLKKEKELPPITEDEIPFELPEGWVWCRWRDLLAFTQYSMKRGPFGSSLKKDMFVEKGIRVFEQYNPINDDPNWVRYYITEKKYEELKAFTAIAGDLLISCSGATLGRITELPEDVEYGIINQALLKLTLNRGVISNEYFILLFRSSVIQETILEEAGGSAIPNMVGVSTLKEILIPLPPLAEQQRIVAKVQQLQQQLSQLESRVQQSREHAQQLLQSVLREAFEGKREEYEIEEEKVSMVAEE